MADDRPTFGSLFAGIGGIDLGLERAGWECRFQVEWDEYCQHVLAHHWPDIPRYGDITAVDWSGVERVDLLAGGFPCQPWSHAGKQLGLADDRWLWPEFERAIRELRPQYVLVENVPGLLVGGGVDAVLGGLAVLGYDTEWESIPAAAVGAPHLRYRVWIVAYANGRRCGQRDAVERGLPIADPFRDVSSSALNGRGQGRQGRPDPVDPGQLELALPALADALGQRGRGRNGQREYAADAHPPGEGVGPAGNGGWWATEPDVGRVAHGVPARVDRLRALGNAVVPQVVEYIGRRILEAEGLR